MKKFLFTAAFLILFAATPVASARTFYVAVANVSVLDLRSFSVNIISNQIFPTSCTLKSVDTQIYDPGSAPMGILNLTFKIPKRDEPCIPKEGPYTGTSSFLVGEGADELKGIFKLNINGEDYGILRISDEAGAIFQPFAESDNRI